MNKTVILVTGSNGQLGSELQELSTSYNQFDFIFTDQQELDITDEQKVSDFFQANNIKYCINAAAYTAVDKAETERELAMLVNATAAGYLAKYCRSNHAGFIHVSTDYVFSGLATSPYSEGAPTDPVNYYGLSKLKGEELVTANDPSAIIIRTSWVYSTYGKNFVKTMLRLMSEKESIGVVSDQFGSPTYAADLATTILQIICTIETGQKDVSGIYHYSNDGIISWYDFATAIKEIAGLNCKVNPIDTAAFPTPAKRPAYSAFDKEKIYQTFQLKPQPWKESLQVFFDKYNQ